MSFNHHGDDAPPELLKQFQAMREGNSTRKWPDGRLSGDDDGETIFKVSGDPEKQLVGIEFPTPTKWVAMPPQQAIVFAQALIQQARRISKEPLKIVIN